MSVETKKYVRKPMYVQAVQVTVENLFAVSEWCTGEVRNLHDQPLEREQAANVALERYIHVRVQNPKNQRFTKAFVGDWILYTDYQGYKVYTQKTFRNSFDPVKEEKSTASAA